MKPTYCRPGERSIVIPSGYACDEMVKRVNYDENKSILEVEYTDGSLETFKMTVDGSLIASQDWVKSQAVNSIRFSCSIVNVTGSAYVPDGVSVAIDSPVLANADANNVMLQIYTENETIMNLPIGSATWTNAPMLGDTRFIPLLQPQIDMIRAITYPIFAFVSVRSDTSSPFMEFKSLVRVDIPDGNGVIY